MEYSRGLLMNRFGFPCPPLSTYIQKGRIKNLIDVLVRIAAQFNVFRNRSRDLRERPLRARLAGFVGSMERSQSLLEIALKQPMYVSCSIRRFIGPNTPIHIAQQIIVYVDHFNGMCRHFRSFSAVFARLP